MNLVVDKNGKLSSKRTMGVLAYVLGLAMACATGFEFYNVDTELILTILGNGTALLGMGVFEKK